MSLEITSGLCVRTDSDKNHLVTEHPQIVTGLILDPVITEFNFEGPFLKLGQNIGLLVGAFFWGLGSDIWGRRSVLTRFSLLGDSTELQLYRWSFNITLLIIAVFAIAAGGSPNEVALIWFATLWSIGVGGNLPVDSAVFLGKLVRKDLCAKLTTETEFIPGTHQYLLTVLSIWWAFGQLVGSLVSILSVKVIGR